MATPGDRRSRGAGISGGLSRSTRRRQAGAAAVAVTRRGLGTSSSQAGPLKLPLGGPCGQAPIVCIAGTVCALVLAAVMLRGLIMDEGFSTERVRLIRDLAEKADSFTKRRLLDLAKRYDDPKRKPLGDVSYPL